MKRLIWLILPLSLHAATVGKITGRVLDAETKEPLAGVDVYISTLSIGGATDNDGYYFILNISPGEYDVQASMIGYCPELRQKVQVIADRTAYVDFSLRSTIIEIDKPVIVVAKRPVIEIDMTSKETRVTRHDLDILPVANPIEAISLQGGVTTDASGDIHIRGGRSGELAYYIDGVEISNALLGSSPFVNKNVVSEMSFLSGTFNAEYGNVMSGVVNIVTPEGGSKTASSVEYTSLQLNPSIYRQTDWIEPASDAHRDSLGNSLYQRQDILSSHDLYFLGEVNASIGGPLPLDQNTRYYVAGHYLNQESYLPFGYTLIRSVNGKLSHRFNPHLKLFADIEYISGEQQHYSHVYKYIHDNYLVNFDDDIRSIIGWNHAIANSFFYNFRVGMIENNIETKVPGLDEDTIIEPVYDNYSEFYLSGYPVYRQTANTRKYVVKADFNIQASRIHNFKFGFEYNRHRFALDKREQLFVRGPIVYQDYTREPTDGAIFLQDKIEHRYLVINAGLRLDYCDPNTRMWEDIQDPTSAVTEVEPLYQISPRIGLSHPITDDAMLHFAYGQFFQMPNYSIMYFNANYIAHPESIPRYGLVGNPRILPQRTTAYEVGVKYAVREIYGIDITLFLKDIKDLLATDEVRVFPYDYIIYTNEDFGSVQGIDITLKRETVSRVGFSINYTYQTARGNRSFPMQGFYDVYTGMPERLKEYYLDFDRRHTFSGTVELQAGERGGATINLQASSGLPYTPFISEGVVVEENSGRMVWELSLDIMLHQGFKVGPAVIDLYAKCVNITDNLNPNYVYSRSGQPWDSGEEAGGLMGSLDYIMDPSNVGARREIKGGMRITL